MAPMIASPAVFIGLRYTRSKRRHQFISFVSAFSLIGMALGTLALIVVLSVMNGFDREIKQRILSVVPHVFMDEKPSMSNWQALSKKIADTPHLLASAPYIGSFAMLTSDRGVQGVEIQGVLPALEAQVSPINRYIVPPQRLENLQAGEYGIVLGHLLARQLGVGIGNTVVMTLPQVSVTPAGVYPRVKRFTVKGLFEVGAQLDQSLALIHLNDAQKLFRYGDAVQGLRLQSDNIYRAKDLSQHLAKRLRDDFSQEYELRDWSQTQGSLFQAIKMEKRMITILLMIIIAVAALNIVTGLILMVSDKRSDIAVLRTMGMTTRQVVSIFMIQGSLVGVSGIVIGAILGCLLALNISTIVSWVEGLLGLYVFDPSVYFISQIPSDLRFADVFLICTVGIVLSVLATLYPAYRASQVEPAEVLRYQ